MLETSCDTSNLSSFVGRLQQLARIAHFCIVNAHNMLDFLQWQKRIAKGQTGILVKPPQQFADGGG